MGNGVVVEPSNARRVCGTKIKLCPLQPCVAIEYDRGQKSRDAGCHKVEDQHVQNHSVKGAPSMLVEQRHGRGPIFEAGEERNMGYARILVHDILLCKPRDCCSEQEADGQVEGITDGRHEKRDIMGVIVGDLGRSVWHYHPTKSHDDAEKYPWPNRHEGGAGEEYDKPCVVILLIPLNGTLDSCVHRWMRRTSGKGPSEELRKGHEGYFGEECPKGQTSGISRDLPHIGSEVVLFETSLIEIATPAFLRSRTETPVLNLPKPRYASTC